MEKLRLPSMSSASRDHWIATLSEKRNSDSTPAACFLRICWCAIFAQLGPSHPREGDGPRRCELATTLGKKFRCVEETAPTADNNARPTPTGIAEAFGGTGALSAAGPAGSFSLKATPGRGKATSRRPP